MEKSLSRGNPRRKEESRMSILGRARAKLPAQYRQDGGILSRYSRTPTTTPYGINYDTIKYNQHPWGMGAYGVSGNTGTPIDGTPVDTTSTVIDTTNTGTPGSGGGGSGGGGGSITPTTTSSVGETINTANGPQVVISEVPEEDKVGKLGQDYQFENPDIDYTTDPFVASNNQIVGQLPDGTHSASDFEIGSSNTGYDYVTDYSLDDDNDNDIFVNSSGSTVDIGYGVGEVDPRLAAAAGYTPKTATYTPPAVTYNGSNVVIGNDSVATAKQFEGTNLDANGNHVAYDDGFGNLTLGYGQTTHPDGSPIKPGDTITEGQASANLQLRVAQNELAVAQFMAANGYLWDDTQIAAIASGVDNMGLDYLNQVTANGTRSDAEIAAKIPEYNTANGEYVQGLQNRRNSEADAFSSGISVVPDAEIYTPEAIAEAPIEDLLPPDVPDIPEVPDEPVQETEAVTAALSATSGTKADVRAVLEANGIYFKSDDPRWKLVNRLNAAIENGDITEVVVEEEIVPIGGGGSNDDKHNKIWNDRSRAVSTAQSNIASAGAAGGHNVYTGGGPGGGFNRGGIIGNQMQPTYRGILMNKFNRRL